MEFYEIRSVLYNACRRGNLIQLQKISLLELKHVKSNNNYAFHIACQYEHLEVLKWLVDTFGLTIIDERGQIFYAFRWACSNGHLEVAKWLVDKFELTLDDLKSDNNHAFRSACMFGHLNILQFLIGCFQLSEDDYSVPVNQHWISLMTKACKEHNRFMVSWFITNNDIMLSWIFEHYAVLIQHFQFSENDCCEPVLY